MAVPSLAELRLAIGRKGFPLRQRELAEQAEIDQGYVSQIETGKRRPSVYLQARLAEIYGVSRDQLRASVAETVRRRKAGEGQLKSEL